MKRTFTKEALFLLSLLFLFISAPSFAQSTSQLHLSKNADFSTEDRDFDHADILYASLSADQIDYTDLDDNEVRLKADNGGAEVETYMTNNLDGTYALQLPLSNTDASAYNWEIQILIKDEAGRTVWHRVDLHIGSPNWTVGEKLDITGQVESVESNGIQVDGLFFYIDDNTDIRDKNANNATVSDIIPGRIADIKSERQADGSLLATRIDLEKDRSSDNEVEFTGRIDALGTDNITVAGITFAVNNSTIILDDDRQSTSLLELYIGAFVEIKGRRINDVLTAVEIKIEDDLDNSKEIEFTGVIEELGSSSVTVNGVVFSVDDQTLVTNHNNESIEFTQLSVGQLVEIKGFGQVDGSVRAVRIHQEDEGEDEVELTGFVEAIDASSVTVSGIVFQVDDNTSVLDNSRQQISFSSIVVGMVIEIRGVIGVNGALRATDIKVEDYLEDEVEVRSTIDTVSADEIVVLGRPFALTDATQFFDASGNASSLSQLAAGNIVEVEATIEPGNLFIALRVKLENDNPDRVKVVGPADSIGVNAIFVAGIELAIDGSTEYLDADKNQTSLDAISAGQTLRVEGARQDPAAPLASLVEIKKLARVIGSITSIAGDNLVVAGASFTTESNTLYLGFANTPLTYQDLKVGQQVEISSEVGASASLVSRIKVLGDIGASATHIETAQTEVPMEFTLHGNYPNPFNPTTSISFDLVNQGQATLIVYNVLGQVVRTLVDGQLTAGSYNVSWDGRDHAGEQVASGLYLYRLQIENRSQTRTMTLVK